MWSPVSIDKVIPQRALRATLALRERLLQMADALVPAELVAYERATAFFATRVAAALVELGVLDAIGDGERTASELAAELDLDADNLHRTLRLAAAQRLVRINGDGRFRLTDVGRTFRSDASPTLAPWILNLTTEATQRPWSELAETIRVGGATFPRVYGESIWQHYADNPAEERLFATAMRELSAAPLAWIVERYPWPERGVVADVAGGSGPVLAGILAANPDLTGILVEAPGVLAEADGHLIRAGVRDRVELREGNIFAGVDAEADLYLLKDILHDWDDERSLQILATIAASMPPGAKLVVIEQLLERNEADPITASVDLHMLAVCDGGRQRSADEIRALLEAAGLEPGELHEAGLTALIEGVK